MWGVVKGFQIACNLPGPLGDLSGKGDQPIGKVVPKKGTRQELDTTRAQPAPTGPNREGIQGCFVWSIDGPLGDWTGTDDQPSGKVVLVRGAGRAEETTSTESEQPEEDTQRCSGRSIGYR